MLNLESETEYVVCYFDGEYNFTTMCGKDIEYWINTSRGNEIRFIFKKSDAVYED